jgi:predicted helicase
MKQFKLLRQAPGAALTKFLVYDSAGSISGSINVPNEAANDLARHWVTQPMAEAALATSAAGKQNPMVSAMLAAARKHPLSRAAVLRGC